MTFAVLRYSLHPSLSSSSIAPVHLCHLTNDCSAAVSLPCIIYQELQRVDKRGRSKEEKKKGSKKERNSLFMQVGRLKGSHSDIQKERMRVWREIDRGADTQRQACAAKAV